MRISDWSSDVCSSDLKLLVHDDVFIQAHPERAVAEGVTISEGAGDAHPVEVFQAGEAPETLAAIGDLPLGIERIERVAVVIGEAHAIVFDNEAVHALKPVDDVRLAVTQHLYLDQAFVRALFFDSLAKIGRAHV